MSRSNDLRAMIVSKLNDIKTQFDIKEIYYQLAQDNALFPHVIFDMDRTLTLADDRNRRDINLIIDVYDKGNNTRKVHDIADAIEDVLDQANVPGDTNLPTLFFSARRHLPDEDRAIKHIQLEFTIQNYERN